jgi:tRNA nucleotidyltransferase (CCA-adding enzyme)
MRRYLEKLPKEIQDLIYLASEISAKKNMPAYLVGGFVRDLILGVKNLDLDIVVEGDGISFAQDLASHLNAKLIRHRRFGTATVIAKSHINPVRDRSSLGDRKLALAHFVSNGVKIDIATARREFYPAPAHLPVVEVGNLKDDLSRRDFTINTIAISISRGSFGELIDFFAGKSDLRNKKIRILHNLSFIDDPTRILRAIRFEQRYNFRIEPETLKNLKEAVRLKMLEKVQPQRIRDELILMLGEKKPLKEIRRLKELAGFSFINPGILISKKALQFLQSIEKQINWFKKVYSQRRQLDTWLIYFTALLEALGIKDIKAVLNKFVFRKGEEKRILGFKKINHRFIRRLGQDKIKPSEIFNLLEPLSYEVIILLKAKYKDRLSQHRIEDFFEIYNGMQILVSGYDLHRLGIAPGPYYQKVFTKVLNAKLDGRVKTKKQELGLIKELIRIKI